MTMYQKILLFIHWPVPSVSNVHSICGHTSDISRILNDGNRDFGVLFREEKQKKKQNKKVRHWSGAPRLCLYSSSLQFTFLHVLQDAVTFSCTLKNLQLFFWRLQTSHLRQFEETELASIVFIWKCFTIMFNLKKNVCRP